MTTVTQKPGAEVPTEIIASSIVEIAAAVRKIRAGRLNEKALLLLISHASDVPQRDIKRVLDAMESLEGLYLKKKPH